MSVLHRDLREAERRGRALLERLHRDSLTEAGDRLRDAQAVAEAERERIAALIKPAQAAGISMTEISKLTGIPRQRLYDLMETQTSLPVETAILFQLAGRGALTKEALVNELKEYAGYVQGGLDNLLERGLVKVALAGYDDAASTIAYFGLTPEGEGALKEQLRAGLGAEQPEFIIYATIPSEEISPLAAVAAKLFGGENTGVIQPGTVSGQELPELALRIHAPSAAEALAEGRRRLAEMRGLADLPEDTIVISAVSPGAS